MAESVYKAIELVGSSSESWDKAAAALGGHFKTGQWWSPQKRPMGMARDSVVLPL